MVGIPNGHESPQVKSDRPRWGTSTSHHLLPTMCTVAHVRDVVPCNVGRPSTGGVGRDEDLLALQEAVYPWTRATTARFVSSCLYQVPCEILLRSMKAPLIALLSPNQAGGCKGHTTVTQAAQLWLFVLHATGELYVALLDIAKAHHSTPHPLVWNILHTTWPPSFGMRMKETKCKEDIRLRTVVPAMNHFGCVGDVGRSRTAAGTPKIFKSW